MGPYIDVNFPRKQKCINEANNDLATAIENNYVVLGENDKLIPIDSREFFGKPPDPNLPNPDFKKPIEENLKRQAVFLTSDGIVLAGEGKFDGIVGQIAHAVGRITEDKVIVYQKGWKPTGESLDPQDMWNQTYTALKDSPMSVPIESIWDVEPYKVIAVMGKVTANVATKASTRQPNGGAMISISSVGLEDDVTGFAIPEPGLIATICDNLETGMEVIIFGDVNKYVTKEGQERKNVNVLGVIANPASSELAAALGNIADIDFE
jgi:hypothetical protein